ncbi:hypothetical protein DXG01_008198 [Tephrocybe rancida]|nr:hypothetical protein DXG01_008198 [Tephrocybe rancida]
MNIQALWSLDTLRANNTTDVLNFTTFRSEAFPSVSYHVVFETDPQRNTSFQIEFYKHCSPVIKLEELGLISDMAIPTGSTQEVIFRRGHRQSATTASLSVDIYDYTQSQLQDAEKIRSIIDPKVLECMQVATMAASSSAQLTTKDARSWFRAAASQVWEVMSWIVIFILALGIVDVLMLFVQCTCDGCDFDGGYD